MLTALAASAYVKYLVPLAAAQPPPTDYDPCNTHLGAGFCDNAAGLQLIDNTINTLALLFAGVAGGGAVLFTVVGGVMMMFSLGDESRFTKGRNAVIYSLVGFAMVLAAQVIVSFVIDRAQQEGIETTAAGSTPIQDLMQAGVNLVLDFFNVMFVIVALVCGFRFVISQGKSDEATKARQGLLYAVIGAFVVNLAHAAVAGILATGFGGV